MTRGVRRAVGLSPRGGTAAATARDHALGGGPVLRAAGLSRVYGEEESLVWAVDGVDLDVPAGQTLAVTGPSGCGKSTLLQLLGGLDRPSEGEVWLGGRRIDRLGERGLARLRRRAVGFVFQAYHLMHELTAAQNVELPALLAGDSPRAARDNRRAGLLKAVGAGPGTVTAVLLAQHLLLTLLATAIGLTAGTLAAPHLVDPSAGLLDTVSPPDNRTVTAAVFLAVVVALTGALGPAVRAARTSTVDALADPAHLLTHHPHLTAWTAHLPTPLLLGIRLLARRPGRAALACAGTAATTIMVTALLTWHTELDRTPAYRRYGPIEVRTDQTGRVLLAATLALVALSLLNTVLLGWSSAVQARRALTITRTLGATPGQVVTSLCVVQLLPAIPGLAVGVPTGLGLYRFFGTRVTPPGPWLLTAALGTLLAVALLIALPAWAHTRTPAGRTLNAEPA